MTHTQKEDFTNLHITIIAATVPTGIFTFIKLMLHRVTMAVNEIILIIVIDVLIVMVIVLECLGPMYYCEVKIPMVMPLEQGLMNIFIYKIL
jgi:hypothetical protein